MGRELDITESELLEALTKALVTAEGEEPTTRELGEILGFADQWDEGKSRILKLIRRIKKQGHKVECIKVWRTDETGLRGNWRPAWKLKRDDGQDGRDVERQVGSGVRAAVPRQDAAAAAGDDSVAAS